MTPIYDKNVQLSAWFDGEHIFDLNLNWVAFLSSGHFFAANALIWLGVMHDGALLDRNGQPVAWLEGAIPKGALKPNKPMTPRKPLPPKKPLYPGLPLPPGRPLTPMGGWSALEWQQWLTIEQHLREESHN